MTEFDIALGLKPQFSFKVSQQLVCVFFFFFCIDRGFQNEVGLTNIVGIIFFIA